jgi:O-antigen/teichoic acid export membrane protein
VLIEAAGADAGGSVGVAASQRLRLRQASWWVGKAFWAVLDQGLFASSSFILGIVLARALSAEQFGSFAVAQSVLLLAGTLHTGLFSEPMLVFGSARHGTHFRAYLDILLRAHWRFTGLGSVLLALLGAIFWFLGFAPVSGALWGAAVATPCVTFGWLVRRACYARLQPQWAAMGGIVYTIVILVGAYLAWRVNLLSAFSALALLGTAGLISGRSILPRLQRAVTSAAGAAPSDGQVLRDHWQYGRWAMASSALSWIPSNSYYVLLPMFAGLNAAGELKAVSNLIMPILLFNDALVTLLLPALSTAARVKVMFNRVLAASLAGFAGFAVLYGAILTEFRIPILNYLYGHAYTHTAVVVPIVALVPVSSACSAVLGAALRAQERPQLVFWTYVASTIGTVTIGIWGMARWGLVGATVGILLSSTITAAMCAAFLIGGATKRVEWA